MKSEQRHQLQQNELAEVLGGGIQALTPYAKLIGIVALGGFLIVMLVSFLSTQKQAHQATASLDFLLATNNEDPESFKLVNVDYPDTQAGQWARQAQADLHLAQGLDALFVDRDEANEFIDAAATSYQSVIDDARDPLLKTRAQLGLAKAYEASGKLDLAKDTYETVVENTTSEALKKQASDRIDALSSESVQNFYEWFNKNLPDSTVNETPLLPNMNMIPDEPGDAIPEVESPDDLEVTDTDPPESDTEDENETEAPTDDSSESEASTTTETEASE